MAGRNSEHDIYQLVANWVIFFSFRLQKNFFVELIAKVNSGNMASGESRKPSDSTDANGSEPGPGAHGTEGKAKQRKGVGKESADQHDSHHSYTEEQLDAVKAYVHRNVYFNIIYYSYYNNLTDWLF